MTRMSDTAAPRLSCIVTAFNEGGLAALSIESLLAQSFGNFEILVVDDGAGDETRATLDRFEDPRIRRIRQANDGLSSARNRGLDAARGDYVCFLDADDTRPPWAFDAMTEAARAAGDPDCVFSPGILQEPRQENHAFYDQRHFRALLVKGMARGSTGRDGRKLQQALRHLACLEPQAANKMVRRDFLETHRLRFPPGLFFEDMLFHTGVLVSLESFAITELPTFTYFRRYGRPQITATSTTLRFDAISTAANTLHLFGHSRYFQDPVLRRLVLSATFKLLKWCSESISLDHRQAYEQALRGLIAGLDARYLAAPDDRVRAEIRAVAPGAEALLTRVAELAG